LHQRRLSFSGRSFEKKDMHFYSTLADIRSVLKD